METRHYHQLEDKALEKAQETIGVLRALPPGLNIFFTNGKNVFLHTGSFEGNIGVLHLVCEHCGNYNLNSYYMQDSRLALNYHFSKFHLVMYCSDAEHALEIVGNGNCSIVDKKGSPTREVVCEVNGD